MPTTDRKTAILSAIDNTLKKYEEFSRKLDQAGVDISDIEALSDLAYTLEDCSKFIAEAC